MSWRAYKVRLRLKTDMHCGSLMLGFVARAFPFAPQHVPLFASVPAAVEALGLPSIRPSYKEMEDLLFASLRTTPFYVLDGEKPLFPWIDKDRTVLLAEFMSSRYGVTLDDSSRSAKEGQLFETEVLLAHRRGSMESTSLEGMVWICANETERLCCDPQTGVALKDGSAAIDWQALFGRLNLGGDRTRALGRLWPDVFWQETDKDPWDTASMDLENEWPCLRIEQYKHCPVPVLLDGSKGHGGKLSVVTGRRLKDGKYVMDNGSVVRDAGWQPDSDVMLQFDGLRYTSVLAY